MKVFTTTQFEKKIYGVAKCAFAKKGFSLTMKTKDADGAVTTDTYNFKDQVRSLPDDLPENFQLEEIKYAVVLNSDGDEISFIRPANLRDANFKFTGFLMDKDGDYLLNLYDVKDKETGKPNGKKQIKYKALMTVVSDDPDDPYAGLQYPVTLPFTNSYGDPHIRRDKGGIMVQGNAEKSKPFAGLLAWLEAVGISDEGTDDPNPDSDDPQDWLAELERLAIENNRIVVGCDTVDGYISAWGESIPDEKKSKKTKAPVKKVEKEEDTDDDTDEEEEEVKPAPKSAKAPVKAAGKRVSVPDDDDD